MKILFLTQVFQPEPMFKGLPFAQELGDRGHTVEVLTGFPNYPGGQVYQGYRIRPWQRETLGGVRVNRVPLYPSHDRSGLRRMLSYLSFALACLLIGPWLVGKPDVIYVYNLVTLGPAAFLLRRLYGAKIILDVTDLWPDSVGSSGMLPGGGPFRMLKAVSTWVYRHVDWLTVVTPGYKRVLVERGVCADRIELIYNWCNENAERPAPRDERLVQELGLAGHFNILYAGAMGVMQGLDTVLDAAQICRGYMPEVQFVLVGSGVDRGHLESRTAEMGLTNVRFLPRQAPEAMGALYALADALLVHLKDDPLFRITIPSKTQAYLYMGRPIIMAMEGDAADLVRLAGAGLVCPSQNPVALVEAVLQMARLPGEERERIGQAAKKFYIDNMAMQVGIDRFAQRMQMLMERMD